MAQPLFNAQFLRTLQLLELQFRRQQAQHLEGRFTALQRGGRVEFADHRTYSPGDDLRYVDWNLYARTGRFFIKEFRKDEQLQAVLLVDASASMAVGRPSKWDCARRVAAGLAFIALAGGNAVSGAAFSGGQTQWSGWIPSRAGFPAWLDFLATRDTGGTTSVADAISALAARQGRPCLTVLLSDLMDRVDPRPGLGVLAARGFDVAVVHVLSPEELRPPWSGPRRLIDAETGRGRRCVLDRRTVSLYLDELNRFREGWQRFCAGHQMLYLPVDSSTPFEELLLHYLRRGGLLR